MERLRTLHENIESKVKAPDIDDLRARAWSFRGYTPPNGAKKVAEETRNGELHEYYIDPDGNVYYETTSGREWKEKIAAWERRTQKKKR